MKGFAVAIVFALTALAAVGQSAPHVPMKVVSDWTHRHVLYPDSGDPFLMERLRRDPRWELNWYLRHREVWWPEHHHRPYRGNNGSERDWSLSLRGASLTSGFEPLFNFAFTLGPDVGYASLDTTDPGNG